MGRRLMTIHWGRAWNGTTPVEDACPCPKEPCGLVNTLTVDQECTEHGWRFTKSARQGHYGEQCPNKEG